MNNVNRFTIFKDNPFGNGADKRTSQISEILSEQGVQYKIIPSNFNPISFSGYYIYKLLSTVLSFLKIAFLLRRPPHLLTFYRTVRICSHFKGIFSIPNTISEDIFLWESTKIDFSYIVPVLKEKGYKIIGLPHNLEALVPTQRSAITNQKSPDWLLEEIKILKECELVFAISKEETLLLKQCGINAEYLPYYPVKQVLERLINIRNIRLEKQVLKDEKKKILILGSAANPPTKLGMINRINYFKNNDHTLNEIIVAGYDTEQLKGLSDNKKNITFLGEVSNDVLFELLSEIDALLIHQPATSGALTRITEFLIAGVPVIANFDSARNFYGSEGLYVYNNDEQFTELLNTQFTFPPCPPYPLFEVRNFQQRLKELSSFN